MRGGYLLLKKLEAYGFKSFAEKTELEFKPGITAIVGPNGSGKSNISDAVRWVLGEQNIRNLRGAKMEDVIFAGSVKRRPLGVAEVTLVFDNSDGLLALDFNEVTITRRVFRSGDSEYYINKSSCRLKDIHDLLVDAGLGRDSMTVISQNKVDEVLNSKADERRLLFEEAAGIIKYKNRKKDALRKLDDTENNLNRVFDITSEIETQLEPLGESARKTTRYNELAQELTGCQVTLLLDKLSHAEKNQESVNLEKAALTDEETDVTARLAITETDKERLTDKLIDLDETIKSIENVINSTTTEIERMDGKAAVLTERTEQEHKSCERLEQEKKRLGMETEENQRMLESRREVLREKEGQEKELETTQASCEEKFQEVEDAIGVVERQIETAKDKNFDHMQELVTNKNTLRTLERDLEILRQRQGQLDKERQNFSNQLAESKGLLDNASAEQAALKQEQLRTNYLIGELTDQIQQQEKTLTKVVAEEAHQTGKIGETASRLKVLVNMQDEYEGFGRGVKSVLKSTAPWRHEVCGAVAQILTVPSEYVVAIETSLGGALQHIIVESDATAKAAIGLLKHQNLGRATFLPLNTIKVNRPREAERAAALSSGAIGFASDLVECEERYRPVVEYLLARTVVAKDIDAALGIARQQAFGVRIVTLDGELVSPGGSITGGSVGRREASFISRSNEIEVLKATVTEMETKRGEVRHQAENIRAKIAAHNNELSAAFNMRRTQELRQAELSVHAEKIGLDIKRLTLSIDTVAREVASSMTSSDAYATQITAAANQIAFLESRDVEHKRQLTDWQEELKGLQVSRERISATLTDSKIRLSALNQEINAIKENCEHYLQISGRLKGLLEAAVAEEQRVRSEIAKAKAELMVIAEKRELAAARNKEQQEQRNIASAAKLEVLAGQQKFEREIKELRRKNNALQSRRHEMELLEAKVGYEIEYCLEQLRETHALSIDEAKSLYRQDDHTALPAKIAELEDEIAMLGPVNPAAIEEFAKLKDRYEFLRTQYQDLAAAKDYLITIIKEIDSTMSRQFSEAFQKINTYFGELYVKLFGGGKAELELVDPDDLLNSGIEISVQPPGKKQQNLALLSGGERALTVIALLFAFLTHRPTPFCVLDEIDAALDEANVQRFSDFLRDYSKGTQFIIVTHRRGTMEAADVMHGVTMEESGISKLVSVKFVDRAG
ncbi:MAG: smc 5 [Firmicutes bacterium]|nr:smc 5 [Bacillota bacterium]